MQIALEANGAQRGETLYVKKRNLMRGICIFIILLMAGCGNQDEESGGSASQTMVSENASADIVSENQAEDTVSENHSQDMAEEMEVFELSNGLYAYVTTRVSGEYERKGVTGWIVIQDWHPEEETFNRRYNKEIMISNVYGTITDIRMDDYSQIIICYEDEEGEGRDAVIPLDFYASEGNVLEPAYGWLTGRLLMYNKEEMINETDLPIEVWSETFLSEGKEYTAAYFRVSPMYGNPYSDFAPLMADYRFAILQDDEVLYEIKLYGMSVGHEELHFMEDVNGDGAEDFIQINNPGCYDLNAIPYVFVWDTEQETCISGGMIMPEEKAAYELPNGQLDSPRYSAVLYDRDTGIFYDASNTERNAVFGHDIHGMVIVCGAKFIDGEWKTVYELYLGKKREDYALETKYDEEGNVISEIQYSEDDQYDVVNSIYTGCELSLCSFWPDYTEEEIVVNWQFSYWKYVRNEE